MIFYFSADGSLIKETPSRVYQGSNCASRIYFVAPIADNNTVTVAFTLPNGEITSEKILTKDLTPLESNGHVVKDENGKPYKAWEYALPQSITQYAGEVTVQFFAYSGGESLSSSPVRFMVEKGVMPIENELLPNNDFEEILRAIGGIANGYFELSTLKQDALESGVNIKTINGNSILGSGNIVIEGGSGGGSSGGSIVVDAELSTTSENPVQNKVITQEFQNIREVAEGKTKSYVLSYNDNFDSSTVNLPGVFNRWYLLDGTEITNYIGTGDYVNEKCANAMFNSINESISLGSGKYIIFRRQVGDISGIEFIVVPSISNGLSVGDTIFVIENDVPDRWSTSLIGSFFRALETRSLLADSELSDISENAVQNKVVTQALNGKQPTLISAENIKTINGQSLLGSGNIDIAGGGSGGSGTVVTVNGEPVAIFDADTKLNKENPTFASDDYGCYIYGIVTPSATSHKPTTVDGMIPSNYLNKPRTIVQRDNAGSIRAASGLSQGLWTSGTGLCITDTDMKTLAVDSMPLTGASGTLVQKQFYALRQSAVLTLSLDNDIYHLQTKTDTTLIYRNLGTSSIKTITVNSDYSWAKTETQLQI